MAVDTSKPDNIGDSEPDGDAPDMPPAPKKKKRGGKVHGEKPKHRLDKKARGGSIHIKPENKGKFTAKAKAAGKTVSEYAKEKKDSGGTLGKEANFAANAAKWHKK